MGSDQFDVAVRLSAATTVLLLAWLQLRDWRTIGLPAILFAPMALCLAAFVIENTSGASSLPGSVASSVANVLSGYAVVFLWWFCLSCFDSQFRLRGVVLGVGLLWAAVVAVSNAMPDGIIVNGWLSPLLVVLGFGIVGHLVWRLMAERSGDLIQRRHDARVMVAVLLGGMLFIDLAADTLLGFAWRPPAFAMTQNAMILAFALWLTGRLLAIRPDVLTFAEPRDRSPTVEPRTHGAPERRSELHRRLTDLMEVQRIFLDPDLTFAAFVDRMGAPERTVRKLVNQELGHDHFRTFLNHYRVAEAQRLLEDQSRAGDKLITIAFDSGFASLASFSRAFRAKAECSPGEYRASARRSGGADRVPPASDAAAAF